MKNIIALFFIACFFTACESTNNNEAQTGKAEKIDNIESSNGYIVDIENSVIKWWGSKPTGVHNGTIKISSGSFGVKDGEIVNGKVIIDMNSIKVLDMKEEKNAKLESHLKAEDFFLTDKHPTATFVLSKVTLTESHNIIDGNLSIKDSTKNISFIGNLEVSDSSISLTSDSFSIDRTKWGVIYKSTSFFSELGERFIDDNVGLIIELKAKK